MENKYSLKNINLTNTLFLCLTPFLAILAVYFWLIVDGFSLDIVIFTFVGYVATGISITAGYHRLFAHKTYDAHPIVKIIFLILGATTFQNSVLKWASDHRLHHSKVDTDVDPYNINEGFFFAHMGWVFLNKNSEVKERYAKDMLNDKLIMFQHNYYLIIAVGFGFVLPTFLSYWFFDSYIGGIASSLVRVVTVHHCTFFINSLCHCFGSKPYTDTNSAKDNWFMAFLTFGEGYHNFHHYFQTDFRNGISWYDFDPTKWLIKLLSYGKLAANLKVTSKKRILDARLNMTLKRVENTQRFAHYASEFEEMKLKILESLKKIETFKKEIKFNKINTDKFNLELAKIKLEEAKKELKIYMSLWKLNIHYLEQRFA
jgi:stearoyl-CoA desaturase (delta-9 desaturase)